MDMKTVTDGQDRETLEAAMALLPQMQAGNLRGFAVMAVELAIANYWRAKQQAEEARERFSSEKDILDTIEPQAGASVIFQATRQYETFLGLVETILYRAEEVLVAAIVAWHGGNASHAHKRTCSPCLITHEGKAYLASPDAGDLEYPIGYEGYDATTNLIVMPAEAIASLC
jgi:hypothetical protein